MKLKKYTIFEGGQSFKTVPLIFLMEKNKYFYFMTSYPPYNKYFKFFWRIP